MSYLGSKPSPELFAKFAKSEGIFLCPDIAFLVPTKTMGAGVFARRPLPAGTVVISCPAAAALSPYESPSVRAPCVEVLQGCYIVDGVLWTPRRLAEEGSPTVHTSQHLSSKDPFFMVVMRLMAELCRPRSPWQLWLAACPRMPQHFFNLSPDQKTFLLGKSYPQNDCLDTATWNGVSEQLWDTDIPRRWRMAQILIEDYPEIWPDKDISSSPPRTETIFEVFCECVAHVSSRNFHREELKDREGPYLLPGLDFLNHSFTPNTVFEVRGGGRKHEAAFTVITSRPVVKGEQIYVTYGECGAARMVAQFQFINDAVRQRDKVRFSVDVLCGLSLTLLDSTSRGEGGSAAPSTPGERETLEKTCRQRIDQLQRLGIVYDEGLYLSRPLLHSNNSDAVETFCNGLRQTEKRPFLWSNEPEDEDEEGDGAEVRLLKEEVRYFCITIFLLVCVDDRVFEDTFIHMNKAWRPPVEAKPVAIAALELKIEAARRQRDRVEEHFPGAENSYRRYLLQGALQSEIDTLTFFKDTFFCPTSTAAE